MASSPGVLAKDVIWNDVKAKKHTSEDPYNQLGVGLFSSGKLALMSLKQISKLWCLPLAGLRICTPHPPLVVLDAEDSLDIPHLHRSLGHSGDISLSERVSGITTKLSCVFHNSQSVHIDSDQSF
ncbi:hypothetical protein Sjap_005058 [Stephania japonica]|uniref:Uncharacterized protein n=1 Tax=Stephania japonica TaxID=461633 RepID=A0AAP0K5R2_9MAGN